MNGIMENMVCLTPQKSIFLKIHLLASLNNFNKMEEFIMKKALIICAAGMSSSLMAKKTTEFLKAKGYEIEVDAVSANEGNKMIEKNEFDLFLISPQTKMYFQKFKEAGERVGKPVVNIPPQAYIPIPMGVEKLGNLILQELPKE